MHSLFLIIRVDYTSVHIRIDVVVNASDGSVEPLCHWFADCSFNFSSK